MRKKLILASASPRRKELLSQMGLAFSVCPAQGEEKSSFQRPEDVVKELALQKAREIADQIEKERMRREKMLGRNDRVKKSLPEAKVYIGFTALKIALKYKDPIRQAEYAYSQIRNEVSS